MRLIQIVPLVACLVFVGCTDNAETPPPPGSTTKTNRLVDPPLKPERAEPFNAAMAPVVASYLKIQTALAVDKIDGISEAANIITTTMATIDITRIRGPNADQYTSLPTSLTQAATKLGAAKTLKEARAEFLGLSKPLTLWASSAQPKGLALAYCSMAEAGWLQAIGPLRNPYYGSSMLECGELIHSGFE